MGLLRAPIFFSETKWVTRNLFGIFDTSNSLFDCRKIFKTTQYRLENFRANVLKMTKDPTKLQFLEKEIFYPMVVPNV